MKEQTAESFEAQLKQLPECVSREMVDEVASNLVCSGARTHRRKLVRALLTPPRHRPEALPHYARLAATLALCFKHVDSELAALLKVRARARARARVRARARASVLGLG